MTEENTDEHIAAILLLQIDRLCSHTKEFWKLDDARTQRVVAMAVQTFVSTEDKEFIDMLNEIDVDPVLDEYMALFPSDDEDQNSRSAMND